MSLSSELEKIEELLKKATPGPWNYETERVYHATPWRGTIAEIQENLISGRQSANAELISLLRNSIESLLAERKSLREAVIVLHSRDAANKKLPHVLCHYCDLIYAKQALAGGGA